ncbi:patatin-like phospholipase family protein [Paludisphaera rhizosphaerae]|uniref:patatin-like phospholipase family protein n=1 Tax=Paludisphaera rhizosphaerae TaxID=2711216 RepID=UPI0013EA635A|nr:patatin-like phospholipase family protein [Paludisphaera rhizosphaerae]
MQEAVSPLSDSSQDLLEPGESDEADRAPESGPGLCLSGGGYRAMLFHVGALSRLNEFGLLPALKRVSSVSGGSITAATLALAWNDLGFDGDGVARNFGKLVVEPIRGLARRTIDAGSVLGGLLNPFSSIADQIHSAYREQLYGDATLQDLPGPPAPSFVLNATNVQTGALWRFSRSFMGDYRVGITKNPPTALALAVTASSAFPPFLSPVTLDTSGLNFEPDTIADLRRPPFTTSVVLSDGGGYDNLGLETVFKRLDTVLVSDAGAKIAAEEVPSGDWARHSYRMLNINDNQVRSLRKRALIAAYRDASGNPHTSRRGAYWGIRTDIADYGLDSALNADCLHTHTLELAEVPTRLAKLTEELQERLINWGYAVCDAAIRRHWPPQGTPPTPKFPYPRGVRP